MLTSVCLTRIGSTGRTAYPFLVGGIRLIHVRNGTTAATATVVGTGGKAMLAELELRFEDFARLAGRCLDEQRVQCFSVERVGNPAA